MLNFLILFTSSRISSEKSKEKKNQIKKEIAKLFNKFIKHFDKKYSSKEEKNLGAKNFEKNLLRNLSESISIADQVNFKKAEKGKSVPILNSKNLSTCDTIRGVHEFSDLSLEEFSKRFATNKEGTISEYFSVKDLTKKFEKYKDILEAIEKKELIYSEIVSNYINLNHHSLKKKFEKYGGIEKLRKIVREIFPENKGQSIHTNTDTDLDKCIKLEFNPIQKRILCDDNNRKRSITPDRTERKDNWFITIENLRFYTYISHNESIQSIGDQKAYGNCYAYAALGLLETQEYLQFGNKIQLSKQEEYECNHLNIKRMVERNKGSINDLYTYYNITGFNFDQCYGTGKTGSPECIEVLDQNEINKAQMFIGNYDYSFRDYFYNLPGKCERNISRKYRHRKGIQLLTIERGILNLLSALIESPVVTYGYVSQNLRDHYTGIFMGEDCRRSDQWGNLNHNLIFYGYNLNYKTPFFKAMNYWGPIYGIKRDKSAFRFAIGELSNSNLGFCGFASSDNNYILKFN